MSNMTLMDFQKEGVQFLLNHKFALLADEMGLGKSAQSIAAAVELKKGGRAERCLVITPNSLKYNFANEIEKFSDEKYVVIDGSANKREKQWSSDVFFYITNYENLLTSDYEKYIRNRKWSIVILDEATFIKNTFAKRSKKAKLIPRDYRWALTGTPIETSPMNIYSIVQFLHPYYFSQNYYSFRNKYCVLKELTIHNRKIKVIVGSKNLEELSAELRPIMLRREKKQVIDQLPEKIYKTISIVLNKTETRAYNELKQDTLRKRDRGESILGNITKALLICDGVVEQNKSSKVLALSDLIDNGLTNAVIFTNWVSSLKLIEEMLKEKDISFGSIYGDVSVFKRNQIVNDFRNGNIEFIVSDSAGEYGLNLQSANTVVFFDYPWSYAKVQQRIDRVHRIGQKKAVLVISILTKDTIEEKVVEALKKKKHMFDIVMRTSKEEFFIKNM